MNPLEFKDMPINKLVDYYNTYSEKQIKRFSDRKTAERRCVELYKTMNIDKPKVVSEGREAMKSSLTLDRTIQCEETGEQWKNAYQMWKNNPGYMTSGQQDRLTSQLYAAAKRGERVVVKVNDLNFSLVNVKGSK